jgi:nitrogenase subunit NifH
VACGLGSIEDGGANPAVGWARRRRIAALNMLERGCL